MNLSTPSLQAVHAYLHYRAATQTEAITALDVFGNAICSTRIVRLTTQEIATNACVDMGKCLGTTTVKKALALLRREGLLITLRSPVMSDVAGFHLLCTRGWADTPDLRALDVRYQEIVMTGYDYRRSTPLPVFLPTRPKFEVAPAPPATAYAFLDDDYNPFDVEVIAPAMLDAVLDTAPEEDCGCKPDRAAERAAKQRAKEEARAARQAEKERVKIEKANADAALTAAARPIVECYIAYATEVKGSLNYGLIWKKAKEMVDTGFTADQVGDYIAYLRSQNFYKTRFINIVFIRENIGSYLLNAHTRDGYDAQGRFDARLTRQAREENARLARESAERAAANGGVDPGEDKSASRALLNAFLGRTPAPPVAASPV